MAGWLRRTSFRARLSSLVALAVGVTVALASLASYFAVRHQLFSQVDSTLQSELNILSQSSSPSNTGPFGRLTGAAISSLLQQYSNSSLQIIGSNGTVVTAPSGGTPLPVSARQAALVGSNANPQISTVNYLHGRYRVITSGGFIERESETPVAVQIARPLSDIEGTLRDLRLILWVVSLSGIGVAVGLGYLVGRATMRPVVRLTAAAEHVAATQDLAATIDEQGDDELARLARAFNSMLAALASSRQQQSQLISDAGHELRTPLTSLRTNIEVLMRVRDLPDSDREELMGDVQGQLEELTTLVGDVVELAREDEQQQTEPIEIRFDSIVAHAVERARRRAPGVTFSTDLTPGSVRAIPALLERAVLNVLDNAAKWSPPSGTVEVRLSRAARWTLEVRDHGPGISEADLPHVFDRFYRAEAARAMPGSGLGLAIVQHVVMTHGGSVTASSPPSGGTLIHIELPIVAEHEPEQASGAPLGDAGPTVAVDGPVFTPWGAPAASEPPPPPPVLTHPTATMSPAPPAPADRAPAPADAATHDPTVSPFAPPVSPFAHPAEPAGHDSLDHIRQG